MGRADFGRDVHGGGRQDRRRPAPVDLTDPDDYATINYTGGTTGKSKGAIRRHRSTAAMTVAVAADFEFPAVPRYLAAAPITHVAGTKVVPTLLRGGTVHLMKGFEPEKFLATIEREKINFTLVVPTMIYVLLDHPRLDKTDLSSLELILYGASPMSPTRLVEGLERIGPMFSQLYGQTECYPVSVLRKEDHDARRPELFASCGFPIASCSVSLRDDDNNEVQPGEAGEICVRAPHAMEQYWKRPEQTAETFKGGWLHTGDVARADERGYLYIVDRKKDMIVSGGFNIFPREVEDVLSSHPDVAMAAVIGVPHEKWGEAVAGADRRQGRHDSVRRGADAAREGPQGRPARAQAGRVRRQPCRSPPSARSTRRSCARSTGPGRRDRWDELLSSERCEGSHAASHGHGLRRAQDDR